MRVIAAVLCALVLVQPMPARAWGMDVHRWLTAHVVDGLPAPLKAFFAEQRAFISEHAADPDLWRVVGLKSDLGEEDPNHFLDIDDLGDRPPFTAVPRDLPDFVRRYGAERAAKTGRLPWRSVEIDDRLVSMFRELGRPNGSPYAADNARYLAAVIAHYIEDAHQPFHATANHDGQLTGQRGIHARFETELVLRNRSTLRLPPVVIRPIGPFRDFIFDTLVESQALVDAVLRLDRGAAAGRDFYDDAYYAAFYASAKPLLEKRLGEAASAVASVIVQAWEQGGRPPLPLRTGPRPPAPIRRGRG